MGERQWGVPLLRGGFLCQNVRGAAGCPLNLKLEICRWLPQRQSGRGRVAVGSMRKGGGGKEKQKCMKRA